MDISKKNILLYGANGYTGALIARYAYEQGIPLLLAGRNEKAILPIAAKYQMPYRFFSLTDTSRIIEELQTVKLVIHAAGPFSQTAKSMVEACIQSGTHYIDINGDLSVFEQIHAYDETAKKAGVMLLPGAGFDVVPTDCLASHLKKQLPDATSLKLGFISKKGKISHGTATTIVEKLGEGGAVRKNGKIIRRKLGHNCRHVAFENKTYFLMSIPWGDVATAFFTTGIPNIETYTGIPKSFYRILKLQFLFNWILRRNNVRRWIQKKIDKQPAGATDAERAHSNVLVWGEATNKKGEMAEARLRCKDGYTFTALSCLKIAEKIMNDDFKTGYQTPALAYGEELVWDIEGSVKL
jgi:short subunit dehydrogenase-like uncharacterized protein